MQPKRSLAANRLTVLSLSAALAHSVATAQPISVPYQMNGSVQRYINNPSHNPSQNDMLILDPTSGVLTLEEDVWHYQTVNVAHWTTGWAGFGTCGNNDPYTESSATDWRAFGVDGVYNSFQQPWTATSYNYYDDPSLPPGYYWCQFHAGSHYVNHDYITISSTPWMEFDLGAKGMVRAYVGGYSMQGDGTDGGTVTRDLTAGFYLHNVPAFPICPPIFATSPYSIGSGNGLAGMAAVDLNHDGFPDVITANYGDHDGSILLNNGDGTFGAANRFGTAAGTPQVVATGDFNHDNNPDFVVGNGSGWVSIFRGDGVGGYIWIAHVATAGMSPRAIAVADLDGDTNLDLAIAGDGPTTTLSVMWGNGDGTFQPPMAFGSGSLNTSHTGIAVADFNGDTIPDLAVTNGGDTVSVVLGLGARDFSPGINYPTGNVPYAIVAADVNSDGHADLAIANSGSSSVSILLGDGLGGFAAGATQPVGAAVVALAKGDINGDGHMDLVTGNYLGTTMTVLMGIGDGTFYRLASDLSIGTGVNAASAVIADLDTDGRLDIATTNASGNGVYTFRQLQLTPAPVITHQPVSANVCVGSDAGFSVFPSSATSRTYRWRRNGTPLNDGPRVVGATSAYLSLPNVSLADSGDVYDCIVTTACGSTTSDTATLMVIAPTVISQQPLTTSACPTTNATFSVTTAGTATHSYGWVKDNWWIDSSPNGNPSAATATLTLNGITPADTGSYYCVIYNSNGGCPTVNSDAAQLFVDAADLGQQGGLPGRDGLRDNNDFVVFIDLFFNQQPGADLGKQGGLLGSDGLFDNNDFVVFIDQFFAAC